MARPDEAQRLRRYRELFERAVALGTTPGDVRRAEAEARWKAADAQLADKRCGTELVDERDDQPGFWWQDR